MYQQNYKLRTYDCDKNKIAKPAGLLQETQDCGDGQMASEGLTYTELFDQGKAFMLSRLDMHIKSELRYGDVLTTRTWPCPSRRATFLRNYAMWEAEGSQTKEDIAVLVSTHWTLVGVEDRKLMTVDDVDLSCYTHDEYLEAIPGAKLKISAGEQAAMSCVGERRISYSDCDCNGHMNNTYYADVVCDQIPELEEGTHRVSTLRIHFSKEAILGEIIEIWSSGKMEPREGADQECRYLFRTVRKSDGEMNIACEIGLVPVKQEA